MAITRSGVELAGIDSLAEAFNRTAIPVLVRWPVLVSLLTVTVAGFVALVQGRPDLPAVSSEPALEAILGLLLGLAAGFAHEFAHAVALSHFGRRSRRAGFGFYWGAISFYVDSTDALTLGRRQRIFQALVGLGVDVVGVAVLALVANHSPSVLVAVVAWRLAVLGVLDIVLNLAPILEVDGHFALADFLDEPDLAPRARRAFGEMLRRRRSPNTPRWMALYGGMSVVFGLGLVTMAAAVFWYAAGDLVRALFGGNAADIVIGIVVVAPLVISLLFSALGLILEVLLVDRPSATAGSDV